MPGTCEKCGRRPKCETRTHGKTRYCQPCLSAVVTEIRKSWADDIIEDRNQQIRNTWYGLPWPDVDDEPREYYELECDGLTVWAESCH